MSAKLDIQLQGPRGGAWKNHDNQGKFAAFVDHDNNQRIIVDAFSGYGKDYKRREQCQITISNETVHSSLNWVGTFEELCKALKIDK